MNDFLELTKFLAAAGQIYLCVLAAVALGLFAFERPRKRHAPELTVVAGLRPGKSARIREDEDESDVAAAKRA